MDPAALLPLLQSHSWLAIALLVIPALDKMVAAGQWPFSVVLSTRARLALIVFGGAVVAALQLVQSGSRWPDALLSGAVCAVFGVMKNGTTLFPPKGDPLSPPPSDPAPPGDP